MRKRLISIFSLVLAISLISSGSCLAVSKPAAPASLKVGKVTENSVTLSWNKVKKASSYKVYYSTKKSSGFKYIKSSKSNKATPAGLKPGRTYYFKVRALRNGKYGKYSKVVKATTRKAAVIQPPAKIEGQTLSHYELVDKLYNGSNTVVSELSLNYALGMLMSGATGNTLSELEDYMGMNQTEMADYARTLMAYYNSLKAKVSLADSVWVNNATFALSPAYRETLASAYAAAAYEKDFRKAATADEINSWCAKKTNNLIKKIVDAGTLSEADLILINALYFKANWYEPYSKPVREVFTNARGEKNKVDMLRCTERSYLENDKATGFMKYYRDGLYFVGILPKESGDFSMAELDIDSLLKSESHDYIVSTALPGFDTASDMNLNDALKALGLNDMFSEDDASLKDIGTPVRPGNLYVSLIKQKTRVKLDKDGTEAAAVTAVIDKVTSARPGEVKRKTVELNRPFAFLIYDKTNNLVLFEGKMVDIK